MLRIHMCTSAEGAKRYHRVAMSRGEYYLDETVLEQEQVGYWHGRGAELLGLEGLVRQDEFHRLCDNLHPLTGRQLTRRMKANRRVGYDINLHVPKSVSLMHQLGGDERIVPAFRDAVKRAMIEMERDVATRVRKDGADTTRTTGNMVWAEFVHHTARPVDGVPDMHLHAHCMSFNATFDATESQWKAADFGPVKQDAPYFQEVFHAYLKGNLADLGYTIERRRNGWELAGVPDEIIQAYSRRTELIEKHAEEHGIVDDAEKDQLGARTREAKLEVESMESLRAMWDERLTEPQRSQLRATLDRCSDGLGGSRLNRVAELATAFDAALSHVFERRSTIPDRELIAAALNRTEGGVTPEEMRVYVESLVADGKLLRGEYEGVSLLTTPEIYAEEQAMLKTVREDRGRYLPIDLPYHIKDEALSDEQREAVRHVLGSRHGVMVIRGRAGVGKTRLMDEVIRGIKASGHHIQPVAPTSHATKEVLREESGYEHAQTVARLLIDEDLQRSIRGQVLWVDEAGLMGISDMRKLIELASRSGARVVLTGDTAQHHAVQRGDALKILETEAHIKPAEVREIRRQTNKQYREACQLLADGEVIKGFGKLETMNAIREVDSDERAQKLAEVYMESLKAKQQSLVISPTHAEGNRVTQAIRESLRDAKKLGAKEKAYTRLERLDLTVTQKRDHTQYQKGDVIQMHQHMRWGLRRGQRARVVEASKDGIKVRRVRDGITIPLDTKHPERFSVYQEQDLKLAKGDRVRITLNGRTQDKKHDLDNGSIYTIKNFTIDGDVRLNNGWVVDKKYGHIQHGYCVTSHAAQGRGVQHVIIAQSAESSRASSMQQFYTSVTRGKQKVTILTDDKERLLKAVQRDASRVSATESMKKSPEIQQQRSQRRSRGASLMPPSLADRQRMDKATYRKEVGQWLMHQHAQKMAREERQRERRAPRIERQSEILPSQAKWAREQQQQQNRNRGREIG